MATIIALSAPHSGTQGLPSVIEKTTNNIQACFLFCICSTLELSKAPMDPNMNSVTEK